MCYTNNNANLNLIMAMKSKDVTKTDIATVLNIHFNTVTDKIEGNTSSASKNYNIGFTFLKSTIIKNIL